MAFTSILSTRVCPSFSVLGSFGTTFILPNLGKRFWNDFQAQIQADSFKSGIWHACGIQLDQLDQGLSTFSDFGVIWIDVHFAKAWEMLLERLLDGLAGCSQFEFRLGWGPHAGGIRLVEAETEPNGIFRTESGILMTLYPEI